MILAPRLAPASRAILEQLGIAFEVVVPDVEELTEGDPRELVLENARRKAARWRASCVLGADTAVALDGRSSASRPTRRRPARFLRRLSGRTHEVWTGVALRAGETDGA